MEALEEAFSVEEVPDDRLPCRRGPHALDVVMRRGEALFRAGDACTRFFVLREGVVKVQAVSRTGREIVLYRVNPGEVCMMTAASLMNGMPYRADGIVEEDARLQLLSAADFDRRVAADDQFRRFVLSSLATRMHGVVRLLQDVAFEGLGGRLAALLLARSCVDGVVRDTHEALALELGSAREVVSRRLKCFEQKGWVKLARGQLDVTDTAALQRLCEWGE